MKRTVLALIAIIISLCAGHAQGTIQQRLQGHPKIDSLVSEMEALGRSVRVSYYYDDRPISDIALITDHSEGYLRSRLQWIRKRLAFTIKALENHDKE